VLRPADAAETADAWRVILEELPGPACLLLTRQGLPVLDRGEGGLADPEVARGGYVLADAPARADAVIVATGSEVAVALAARDLLAARGDVVRVVSMPSWELFAAQHADYRETVLPASLPTVAVEAGVSLGWSAFADRMVGIERFGASAPGAQVMERLGITAERVATAVRDLLVRF
jgi:transketolase